jgi:hypothetical protein
VPAKSAVFSPAAHPAATRLKAFHSLLADREITY